MDPDELPSEAEAAAVRDAAGGGSGLNHESKKWWRWVAWGTGAAAALLVVFIALLPTLLSRPAGANWLASRINARIPGTVSADHVDLHWFNGITVLDVTVSGPGGGGRVARVETVRLADAGLWALLSGSRELGAVTVEGVELNLERDAAGRMNLDRALGTSWFGEPGGAGETSDTTERKPSDGAGEKGDTGGGRPAVPPGLVVDITLRDVAATMTGAGFETVAVTSPEATLTVAGPTRLGLTLRATVEQGADSGRVELAGTVDDLFNQAGRWTVGAARFDVDGSLFRLPLAAVDRLLGLGDASALKAAAGGGHHGGNPDRSGRQAHGIARPAA